jgi:putative Mg2+ transporter-C (MgtC) family protein
MATDLYFISQLLLASALGALLGWERERRGRPAGIRTHLLVTVSAALFAIIGITFEPSASMRVAANIVVGVGFLGAGMIIRDEGGVHGLTTAASIWGAAAVGVAVAVGLTNLALVATAIMFAAPFIPHVHPDHADPVHHHGATRRKRGL